MPKERTDRSVSISKSAFSPYRCCTSQTKQKLVNEPLENETSLKEWEDARCPVCMEHPHNAILLLCSSHNNGCRPYMCDTSYRHSNCFDQFRKSFSVTGESQPSLTVGNNEKSKFVCPLCRGEVNGWVVVKPARLFMNTKARSCASETCDFSGTYTDLRKHARLVHPFVRPSEVDPTRQQDWTRMERQRDLGDLLSMLRSSIGEERDQDSTSDLSYVDGRLLTILFLFRAPLRSRNNSSRPVRSRNQLQLTVSSRARSRLRFRPRPMTRLWGEGYVGDSRDGDVDDRASDGESGSGPGRRSFFHSRRRRALLDSDDES